MCGIAGIYSFGGEQKARSLEFGLRQSLDAMVKHLVHRGPDDLGVAWIRKSDYAVGLGHTRLSIIDLSPAGHQPMPDVTTGNYISFNGEIYNYKDLRKVLDVNSEHWKSRTDTEVILKAYAKWGTECVKHLRGIFAFAIWDAQRQQLFIARDHLGVKPLYYYVGEDIFVFASEVRSILASKMAPRAIDPIALNEYLTYQAVPSPRTMIEGVRALPPGTWLLIDSSGHIVEHKYWDPLQNLSAEARAESKPTILRRTGALLRESASLNLVSDLPVGVFLSGGIDSSAIVALVSELGYSSRTFSIVFSENGYDESAYARQVAARFRTDHTEIHLTADIMLDHMPHALAALDQPTGDGINTYVVSQAVKNAGITVALSGLGGDEFFVGYPSFLRLEKALRYLNPLQYMPILARYVAAGLVELAGGRSIRAAKTAAMICSDGELSTIYPITRQVLTASRRRSLFTGQWKRFGESCLDPYVSLLQKAYQNSETIEPFAKISYAEGRTYMHDVLLRDTDQMSMAHALEVRVPLLDHKLVEYLMGVPDEFKRPNGSLKPLLVNSLGDLLPHDTVRRPKQGFTLPFAEWMRGGLRKFCEERLSSERIAGRGIFDPKDVSRLWRAFINGSREVSWSRLWVLIVLEEWLEQNGVHCSI